MNRVKQLREARGLRRKALASTAGISYDYLRRLELRENTPSLDIARAIAKALGTTVDKAFPIDAKAAR